MTWRVAALCLASAACLDAPPTSTGPPGDDATAATRLLASFRFDPDPAFLADSSGNGLDATCKVDQCPVPTVDRLGQNKAALFDGVDDLLTVDALGYGAFTVMLWLRVDVDPGDAVCPINKPFSVGILDSWQLCVLREPAGTASVYFYTSRDPMWIVQTIALELGSWHHAAIRWDGIEKSLWWDGVELTTGEATTMFDGNPVRIGTDLDGETDNGAFPGALDDVEIWEGALDNAAIGLAAGF